MTCPECSGPMPTAKSSGRPPTYCSPACRRAAEYAIRRAQVLLTRAQRAEQDAGMRMALEATDWHRKDATAKLTYWRGEVERLRMSLRDLLAGVGTEDEQTPGTTEARP
jgi:hypothetical protein